MPFQRHDALITLAVRRLIEGDRQITLAEQRLQRRHHRNVSQLLRIEPDVATKLASPVVADEQVDDAAFGLRLQRQLTSDVLKHGAQQRGQGERFG